MKKTEKRKRADCQRIELHSSANLFKVRLVDVLLFGGEHMSTTAVPPWIGSDCVRARCISGSRAKSEWSELSHFWYECSTWFTCLFFPSQMADIHCGQNCTWLERSNFSQNKDAEVVIVVLFNVLWGMISAAVLLPLLNDSLFQSTSSNLEEETS